MSDVYVCMHGRLGGLGACSPRKFLEIRCSEIASEAILRAVILYKLHGLRSIASSFGLSIYAFAKLADIKFLYDRRYYGWQSSKWSDR